MKNEQLKNFLIFKDLNEDEVSQFSTHLNKITVEKGSRFIVEGDKGDSIYLLLKGRVEINQALTLSMNKSETDDREKSIIVLTSDEYPQFGEMSIFSEGDTRTANVRAETSCILAQLHKTDLFNICELSPKVGYKVMRNLGQIITKNLVKANQNVLKLTTAFSLILDR